MKRFLLMSLIALSFASCKNYYKDAKKFEAILEANSGQDQTLAKMWTEVDGYMVFKNEVTGVFTAYNIDKFNRKKMDTYQDYIAATTSTDIIQNLTKSDEWIVSGHWYQESSTSTQCDANGENCQNVTTYWDTDVWVDTSHWESFYSGSGFRFSNSTTAGRDLDTLAALREEAAVDLMGHHLASEYSLSGNRAEELAKLAWRYKKLESKRELTANEKDVFALESLGVSFGKVEAAVRAKAKGSDDLYEHFLEQASVHNRTTPEQIGRFFDDFIAEEI